MCRVIRPPGGGSSISFGYDAPQPSKQSKPRQQASAPVSHPKPQKQADTPPPKAQQPPRTTTTGATSASDGINAGKSNKAVHTSSKVLNPPGGKTSISFF